MENGKVYIEMTITPGTYKLTTKDSGFIHYMEVRELDFIIHTTDKSLKPYSRRHMGAVLYTSYVEQIMVLPKLKRHKL